MRMPRTLWDLEDWLGNRNYYSDVKCSSRPRATALARLSTSSLRKILWTYHLTVLGAMNSRAAISWFERPSASSERTSRSRLVRGSGSGWPVAWACCAGAGGSNTASSRPT
jgi:hypothetical protein